MNDVFKEYVKNLEKENEGLKRAMRIHAGDICSLNNEVEMFASKNEELECECSKGRKLLERLLEALQLELPGHKHRDDCDRYCMIYWIEQEIGNG